MPLVTVSEVLRLALPSSTEVVAGAAGLGNAVTWARLLRSRPTSLGRIERGEVWLLSAAALQLVAEVHAEADEVHTPILRVPRDSSLAEIEKVMVGVLVDRDRAIGQRVQEVYERLLATLVEDRGLELISDIVAEVTDKAVYLLDEHFQPTVQTGGGPRTADALADVRRRYWEGQLGNVSERPVVVRSAEHGPTSIAL